MDDVQIFVKNRIFGRFWSIFEASAGGSKNPIFPKIRANLARAAMGEKTRFFEKQAKHHDFSDFLDFGVF